MGGTGGEKGRQRRKMALERTHGQAKVACGWDGTREAWMEWMRCVLQAAMQGWWGARAPPLAFFLGASGPRWQGESLAGLAQRRAHLPNQPGCGSCPLRTSVAPAALLG